MGGLNVSLSNPLVSVVIPAYNAEPFIRDALDSLMAQTYRNLEVLVVDDGSTDGTRQAVMSYGDRVKYVFEENSGGCSRPRNLGIEVASGELLAFLDADDVMAVDRVSTEVDFFACHPEVALVFSNFRRFTDFASPEPGHFSGCPRLARLLTTIGSEVPKLVLESSLSTELLLTENFGSSSPMVRRRALDVAGRYDESLTACEDFDFQYRVAASFPIGVIPRVGWFKREHGRSMHATISRIHSNNIVIRRRMLDRESQPGRRRQLKRALAQYHLDMAYFYTGHDNGLALRYAWQSLKYRRRPSPRHWLRILADTCGRDTLHLGATRGRA
jgi:glycosyltransferase involved in cell wall biosynthesis